MESRLAEAVRGCIRRGELTIEEMPECPGRIFLRVAEAASGP